MKPLRPTPKLIFPRTLYTPSANGPLAFFDSPPSASTSSRSQRLSVDTAPRASGESHWHQQHNQSNGNNSSTNTNGPYSLALSTSHAQIKNGHPFSGNPGSASNSNLPAGVQPPSTSHSHSVNTDDLTDETSGRPRKRARLDPQVILQVGAYGIPKKRAGGTRKPAGPFVDMETPLSVQVGEDAYFISEHGDAMGVADGVGGWAKHITPEIAKQTVGTTPSALFAKRLMHFCAEEASEALHALQVPLTQPIPPPPSPPKERRTIVPPGWNSTIPLFDYRHPTPLLDTAPAPAWHWNNPIEHSQRQLDEWQEQLDETIEDLTDGLDVLSIMSSGVNTATLMERALEKTLEVHTVPAPVRVPSPRPISRPASPSLPDLRERVPLLAGSSTALVAVLDHVLLPENDDEMTVDVQMSTSPTSSSFSVSQTSAREPTAVIKIAHVGDCLGMLIRDEQIVWRSQEMWVAFNTPVQLSPLPGAPHPSTAAQIAQLRVKGGDILILASDGLSDNLWDTEILDEVRKVKSTYVPSASAAPDGPFLRGSSLASSSEYICFCSSLKHSALERRVSVKGRIKRKVVDPAKNKGETPFSKRAKECGKEFAGGKKDDISVVVAVIEAAPPKHSQPSTVTAS
ncbi:hypothetical protein DL96DRAFT_1594993 [Flagelloscypha sp. PMI_526]|nr:hypothetical protein DL96DRAFT_1594993 [Flagelloscypha sp. PMI_526]